LAQFKVDWIARITGRGTAIAGQVIDGPVRVGDQIIVPTSDLGGPLIIVGVEAADNVSTGESWVTLVVPPAPAGPRTETLQKALIPGTMLEIVSEAQ
jgi:hypothetical protein